MIRNLSALVIGTVFGAVLTVGDVANWTTMQAMFAFEEAYMFLVLTSAIATAALAVVVIRRFSLRTVDGTAIVLPTKTFTKGTVIGSLIFGIGWAIGGACPGPIFALAGAGLAPALILFGGALAGTYLYARLHSVLPH